MATRELQTAAARVIHLVHPTDRDVRLLTEQLHLHPHDAEALLSVKSGNHLLPYRDDVRLQLVWPAYDGREKHLTAAEVILIIGPQRLIIADRLGLAPIEAVVDDLMVPNGPHWQDGPELILAALLLKLARWTDDQVQAFQADIVTSVGDRDRQQYAQALGELTAALSDYVDLKQSRLNSEIITACQLAIHRLRHQAQTLRTVSRAATRPDHALQLQSLPKVATGYAWASAAMVLVMLGWMIGKI